MENIPDESLEHEDGKIILSGELKIEVTVVDFVSLWNFKVRFIRLGICQALFNLISNVKSRYFIWLNWQIVWPFNTLLWFRDIMFPWEYNYFIFSGWSVNLLFCALIDN